MSIDLEGAFLKALGTEAARQDQALTFIRELRSKLDKLIEWTGSGYETSYINGEDTPINSAGIICLVVSPQPTDSGNDNRRVLEIFVDAGTRQVTIYSGITNRNLLADTSLDSIGRDEELRDGLASVVAGFMLAQIPRNQILPLSRALKESAPKVA